MIKAVEEFHRKFYCRNDTQHRNHNEETMNIGVPNINTSYRENTKSNEQG